MVSPLIPESVIHLQKKVISFIHFNGYDIYLCGLNNLFYLRGNSGIMTRTVEEILKDILLLAPEAREKLIHYINLQLPQGSDGETSVK